MEVDQVNDRQDSASTDGDVPRIIVRHSGSEPTIITQIEHGIEEEGVPWTIHGAEANDSDPSDQGPLSTGLAYQAASNSGLKVGIGVSEDGTLTLHHARLPANDPLVSVLEATTIEARTVGTNAARMAKRMPLKPLD